MFPVGAVWLLLYSQPLLAHQGIQVIPELEDSYGNVCKHFIEKVCVVAVSSFMQRKKYGWE